MFSAFENPFEMFHKIFDRYFPDIFFKTKLLKPSMYRAKAFSHKNHPELKAFFATMFQLIAGWPEPDYTE